MASPSPSVETLKEETFQDPSKNIEVSKSLHSSPLPSADSCGRDESPNPNTKFDSRAAAKSRAKREMTASLDDLSKVKERVLKSVSSDPENPPVDTMSIASSSHSLFASGIGTTDEAGANDEAGASNGTGASNGAGAGASNEAGTSNRAKSSDGAKAKADNESRFNPSDLFRTNSLWDFVQVDSQEELDLSEMTLEDQQEALLYELIYTLSGIRGELIIPLPRNPNATGINQFETNFRIHEGIDKSLAEMVNEILPLASNFVAIQKVMAFTEGRGQVNNALIAALRDLSQDFLLLLAQAEGELEVNSLTLTKMLYYMQPTLWVMKDMWSVLSKILLFDLKGAALLTHMCECIKRLAGNESTLKPMIDLTAKAAQPYMATLQLWIQKGVIVDNYNEFMIMDNESNQKGQLGEHFFNVYWEKRYTIRSECVPSFLENYSDIILRTGKYLNVIRQCGKREMPSLKMDVRYNPRDEKQLVKVLNNAYNYSAQMLLDVLLNENDLMGHLQSVKRYLLLCQGDFIMEFMDACENELVKNVDQVLPMALENLLGLSLRLSSARNDKYKDNLHCELLTYDLVTQLSKIMKPTDVKWETTDRLDLSGLECFAFTYQAKWPVSLVINHTTISKYQMLFRQLFYCKHVERQLCNIWKNNSMANYLPSYAFTLRQRMMNAIQNLEYYMMIEIIEPNWHQFVVNIRKVENIDELFILHQDFLDVCLKNCMLTEQSHLNRAIFKLCKICLKFCEFTKSANKDQSSNDKVKEGSVDQSNANAQRVKNFDSVFTSLLISFLKQLNDLAQANTGDRFIYLVHRINFNGYYSEEIEKLRDIKCS
ncbi:hypothetical protein ACLKA7_002865 [Drosophila subpalustris]